MTQEQWSPAQIVGWLRKTGRDSVCVETIYAYIRADKANGGDLWRHCRHQLKHRKRLVSTPYTAVRNRTIIDDRPADWDGSTPGDFEMDTVVGKDGKGAIVTLVERNTNFTLARKLPEGKNAKALARMVVLMRSPSYRQDKIDYHRQRKRVRGASGHCRTLEDQNILYPSLFLVGKGLH